VATQWEYCLVDWVGPQPRLVSFYPDGLEIELFDTAEAMHMAVAQLGLDGWEMTSSSVLPAASGGGAPITTLYFKRPIEDGQVGRPTDL
jgi:hypothetical protein